ncbi:hypothetical protein C2845_PM05G16970 [Panicum miliaceum]|uniref:F-box domain-containing protein n=1 Tax=Panicum miliaceum TaxID=4540 RepID=A0A3L6T292_PANMI|nr:hypothetical protein C2845_PM05G16970 [Panicum miliaceum]
MASGSSSKKRTRRRPDREPSPAAQLTDDLLVEILACVPHRSLCRFRCVSARWRALISHPDHRARLPQTLAGFFRFEPTPGGSAHPAPPRHCFTDAPGIGTGPALIDASFSFLPAGGRLRRPPPLPLPQVLLVCLGFEPAFSSHFHVFEFQLEEVEDDDDAGDGCVLVVKIYSSATGVWSYKQSGWSFGITPLYDSKSGKTWRAIDFPRCEDSPFYDGAAGFIDLSQGRLHLAIGGDVVEDKLAIWVLEDGDSGEWTLKHTVSFKHLVGKEHVDLGFREFIVVAIHPDHNLAFFVFGHDKKTLMSYDMDSGRVHIIHDLGDCGYELFLPYVPLFSKSLPVPDDGNENR